MIEAISLGLLSIWAWGFPALLIYPSFAGHRFSRWKVAAVGLGLPLALAVVLTVASQPGSDLSDRQMIPAMLGLLGGVVWFVWAIWCAARDLVRKIKARHRPILDPKSAKMDLPVEPSTTKPTPALVAIAELVLENGYVDQREAEVMLRMFEGQPITEMDPLTRALFQALDHALSDGVLADTEAEEIRVLLSEILDRPTAALDSAVTTKKVKYTGKPTQAKRSSRPPKGSRATAKTSKLRLESGSLIQMDYTNAEGASSERLVQFLGSTKKGGTVYLNGLCSKSNAYRTFRADRISSMVVCETGEVVSDPVVALS